MSVQGERLFGIMHGFKLINQKHRRIMEKHLNRTGVFESQHRLLMHISKHTDDFSQKRIADEMRVSAATIAVSLKKLEKGGYVERLMDESDNRFNKITITEKGRQVVEESKRIFLRVDEAAFAGFTNEELDNMIGYIERIRRNLDRADELEF